METKTPIQFNILNTEMLASIEGGTVSAGEVARATGSLHISRSNDW